MTKYSKKGQEKVEKTMHEDKRRDNLYYPLFSFFGGG